MRLVKEVPSFIEVETCTTCNRRCVWCPVATRAPEMNSHLMEWSLFTRLASDLNSASYSGWIALHNFNEPLLNHRLFAELGYLRHNLAVSKRSIFTNGDYLTSASLTALEEADVKYLRVTCYPTKVAQSQPAPQLVSWLDNHPWSHQLTWQFEESRQGFGAVARVGRLIIHVISPDVRRYVARTRSASVRHDRRVTPCSMPSHFAAIDVLGRVKMCCNVNPADSDHAKYIVGSIADHSFLDLWSSTQMCLLREAHTRADWSLSPLCETCYQTVPERESPVLQAMLQEEIPR